MHVNNMYKGHKIDIHTISKNMEWKCKVYVIIINMKLNRF